LEEKGLIDRQQKGILKDLIICGDEELQQALDKYESGDPAELEAMIRSGTLQNKAVPDLDLLGDLDLDLDFLTVNDVIGDKEGPGMYSLPQQQQKQPLPQQSSQKSAMMKMPPPTYSSKKHPGDTSHPNEYHDDGIGELEFTGDFGDYGDDTNASANSNQFGLSQPQHPGGKQHRAQSPALADDNRLRSNSLFSALINEPKPAEHHDLQYGRWMDRVVAHGNNIAKSSNTTKSPFGEMDMADAAGTDSDDHSTSSAEEYATSQPIPIFKAGKDIKNINKKASKVESPDPPKKKGRRKSDTAALEDRKLKARLRLELADQKRREKQEKRDQKEREKVEKREARLLAKAEKKKVKDRKKDESDMVVDEEEKIVHIPGSGRPRSMSDPNFRTTRDEFGLVEIERPDGWVGAYSPESRKKRIEKFLAKRHQRVWTKTVKYDVRKNFADSRLRVKGRFVKKEDEMLMRDLMSMT
jgi:CCT motif